MDNEETIPLRAWALYFPEDEYTAFNKEIPLIMLIRKALDLSTIQLKTIFETAVFECDYEFFSKFKCPPTSLKCFSCAVSEKLFEEFNEIVHIETRITNHNEISSFSDVSTARVDTLVTLIGTCCRVGFKRIENQEAYFECTTCSRILKVYNQNNIYKTPKCNCKGKQFIFLSGHPETKCIDKQEIKIQELFTNDSNINILEVDLYGSLVGMLVPGDLLQLTGIIRAELSGEAYKLKVECNNLQIIKNRNYFRSGQDFQTDFQTFKKISEQPNLIGVFVRSLFPNIYGNALIKAGLVLSLFGGTRKYAGSQQVRPEIHVLIVGDPGLGKSQLLLNVCSILPKSTYISGNFCTTAGLTVSITHDPITGEYMADAGALVVSDGGICCIDEFDKIDDHTALYEAMEDQRVTVAKAGVCCSVPTRATIIAASNPRNGQFDMSRSIKDNLKFDTSLMSRFDLIFVLKDDLNEQENYEIGNQILKRRHCTAEEQISTLVRNLREDTLVKSSETVYSQEILKKYIEYARLSVNPVLSKIAREKIKEYYLELRKEKNVSIRNLESLIRLTESCAKLELKTIASAAHASFAISLYRKVFIKEGKVKGEKKENIEEILRRFIEEEGTSLIKKEELMELIKKSKMKRAEHEVLELLNSEGMVIKKEKGLYKINI